MSLTFGQPLWFWAFALLPVLLALFLRNEAKRGKLLRQLIAARLQDRLAGTVSAGRRRGRLVLLLLGIASVIASLARPQLGETWEQSKRKGRDVLIAIDCSKSMLATDLAPNRLARAKLAAQDFLGQLGGDRVGLIAFAGTAFLQAPLTIDYSAVLGALEELDTEIIPRGGTDIAAAVKAATEAFGKGESDNRCLLILTDGEELDQDGVKAAAAQNGAMRIFTVGLGSAEGSLIPVAGANGGTDFVKDASGQIVKSRLDEERLRKIAEATGGFYVRLQNGPADMQHIVRDGLGSMKEQEIDTRLSRHPIERYQWPLSAGLALLAASMLIGDRKRAQGRRVASPQALAAVVVLVGWLAAADGAQAKNAGVSAYERQDFAGALQEFSRQLQRMPDSAALHFDAGAAAYKAGDFSKALEAFGQAVTSADPQLRASAEYNLGNTLYQRGATLKDKEPKLKEWTNALQHYDEALKSEAQKKDAQFNRDAVQRLIDELKKEPPKSDQQKPQDKKDDPKKDDAKEKKEPSKGGGESPKQDQKKDGEQKQDKGDGEKSGQPQSGKDGEAPKPQDQGGKKDSEASSEEKGEGEKQKPGDSEAEKKPEPQGQAKNPSRENDAQKGEQPAPNPGEEKKHEGEISAQSGTPPPPSAGEQAAAQEAEEQLAAAEGKMTEKQANQLLEGLKDEDTRVQLSRPEDRRGGRILKDW